MNNLKKFETEAEYQAWKDGDDYVFPNICKVGEEVVYNNYPDPFWIEALEDVQVLFTKGWESTNVAGLYSYDKKNWTEFSTYITVRNGEKLYIKFHATTAEKWLWVSGKYNVGGSILSLVYGDEYLHYDTHRVGLFTHLFEEARTVINAKELVLASVFQVGSSSTSGMYYKLFEGCSLLETPPKLPNTVASYCYVKMFSGCSSLKKAPSLLCTKFENTQVGSYNYYGFYNNMFQGCSSLSYIKMLQHSGPFSSSGSSGDWTSYWVDGVSPTGTFIASSQRTNLTRGIHGIPEGWDLYLYDEENDRYVVKFKVNNIPYEFYTDTPRKVTWKEFVESEQNTNGFRVGYSYGGAVPVITYKDTHIKLNGEDMYSTDNIVLNGAYTIG